MWTPCRCVGYRAYPLRQLLTRHDSVADEHCNIRMSIRKPGYLKSLCEAEKGKDGRGEREGGERRREILA